MWVGWWFSSRYRSVNISEKMLTGLDLIFLLVPSTGGYQFEGTKLD